MQTYFYLQSPAILYSSVDAPYMVSNLEVQHFSHSFLPGYLYQNEMYRTSSCAISSNRCVTDNYGEDYDY